MTSATLSTTLMFALFKMVYALMHSVTIYNKNKHFCTKYIGHLQKNNSNWFVFDEYIADYS